MISVARYTSESGNVRRRIRCKSQCPLGLQLTWRSFLTMLVPPYHGRLKDGALVIPAKLSATHDGEVIDCRNSRPLGDGLSLAINRKASIVPAIVSLGFFVSPTAIVRLIVAIGIDAVNCQPRRRLAHVGQEILEQKPSIANSDAASAVVTELSALRSETAALHKLPDVPRLRFAHHVPALQGADALAINLPAPASARLSGRGLKESSRTDKLRAATVALAKPDRPRVWLGMEANDRYPAVFLPSHILKQRHSIRIVQQQETIKRYAA